MKIYIDNCAIEINKIIIIIIISIIMYNFLPFQRGSIRLSTHPKLRKVPDQHAPCFEAEVRTREARSTQALKNDEGASNDCARIPWGYAAGD